QARRWLLDAIGGSRERVHVQVYMAADDDVGAQVEAALGAAGARGVQVRLLVDSLHGLHGSLGLHNPLLERLAAQPGVELLVSRPIRAVPSLEDLKQRDHRKLAIIDGAVALLGGRNLSHEYYTGFDEVRLKPESPWRDVPWLDAGARVQGPAVAALERHFLEAWTEAGGSAFDVREQLPAGRTPVRVVVHRGLRDAATLEAYLAMIDGAESHVYAVNGFPLILEIQHALLRAIRRGVRVCVLFGHLTPRYGGGAFKGPWARVRTAATEYVHSRVDALVAAGGEAYQLGIPKQPGWGEGVGAINPHVHAKVMSADGRVCSVGSANLDITAGYWESELMLLVQDAAIARSLETRIEQLLAASERVDRDDPAWRRLARRRDWMRHWPGVLSI
ncbi:MAG TPA: phosphatidylserine/phosphatidylglycerophosphate/cardiolipin synthase family protein, partial [Longimicrobiales bacterium]